MEQVKQTGFIDIGLRPSDYRTGALTYIERITTGDWRKYYPTNEQQYTLTFDTLSCTTFSALNCIEMQVNWMIANKQIPQENIDGLTALGFIDSNGKFNCSDRFTAIMSGTTTLGNNFQAVWDSIRKDGLLADVHFPFGGTSWDEYHDKTKITASMKMKAKEVLKYLSFAYQFETFDSDINFSPEQQAICRKALKQAPLHIAIPVPGTHAISLGYIDDNSVYTFDQYPPYEFTAPIQYPIHFALKGVVEFVKLGNRILKLGMSGADVKNLQKLLNAKGYTVANTGPGSPGKETEYFGMLTQNALKKFQENAGLKYDGIYGPLTRQKLESAQKKSLVDAIIQVESQGNVNAIGDLHLVNKAYGCMQIRLPVCIDVNKALGTSYKPQDMLGNRALSIKVFEAYMSLWATPQAIGRPVTDEDRARIWNGGPKGYKNLATVEYWGKVKKYL